MSACPLDEPALVCPQYMTTGGSSESDPLSSSEGECTLGCLRTTFFGVRLGVVPFPTHTTAEENPLAPEPHFSVDDQAPPAPTPDAGAVYDRLYHSAAERRQARKQVCKGLLGASH